MIVLELGDAVSKIEKCGWRPIIQEYLIGEDNEYTTGMLVDAVYNRVISSVSIKKYLIFGQTCNAFIDDFFEVRKLWKDSTRCYRSCKYSIKPFREHQQSL